MDSKTNWFLALVTFLIVIGGMLFLKQAGTFAGPSANPSGYLPPADSPEIISASWQAIYTHTGEDNFSVTSGLWLVDQQERVSLLAVASRGQSQEMWLLYVELGEELITAKVVRRLQ